MKERQSMENSETTTASDATAQKVAFDAQASAATNPIDISDQEEVTEKYEEGQVLSINYTPAGPIKVIWQNGEQVVLKPYAELNYEIPGGISASELQYFSLFCLAYEHLVEAEQTRRLPLLLSEVTSVIPKPVVKKLRRKGLIDIQTLQIKNDKNKTDSRAFCWLTNEGYGVRQAIREKMAEQKAEISSKPNPMADEVSKVPDKIQV